MSADTIGAKTNREETLSEDDKDILFRLISKYREWWLHYELVDKMLNGETIPAQSFRNLAKWNEENYEFRTLCEIISKYLNLGMRELPPRHETEELLSRIKSEANRIQETETV